MNHFVSQFKRVAPILLAVLFLGAMILGLSAFTSPAPQTKITVQSVLDHHMQALNAGDAAEVAKDYIASSIFISHDTGVIRGKDNIQAFFEVLINDYFPGGQFTATTLITEGDVAYLEWTCEGPTFIATGVDTFVIHGANIHVQTGKMITYEFK